MLKNGIDFFYYYESIWNSGDYIFKFNKTIGYIVKLFVVNVFKNSDNFLKEENKEKLNAFFQEFQNILNQLSYNEKNINLNLYSNFVEDAFHKVINEDLNQNITYQTVRNFRIVGDLFEVFQFFNALDNQLLRLQQFCRWKAKYIEDCLNKGDNPIRGGLNEFVYYPENDPKYFIQFNINSIQNLKVNNKYPDYNNNQNTQTQSNNNIYPENINSQYNETQSNNNVYQESNNYQNNRTHNNNNIYQENINNQYNETQSNNNIYQENINSQYNETQSNNNVYQESNNYQNNRTHNNNNIYPEYNNNKNNRNIYPEYNDNQNIQTKTNNNKYPEYKNNIEKSSIDNLNNTNKKAKYPNLPQEYNINEQNKINNKNLNINLTNNNINNQSQIENKNIDNINNQENNKTNIISSINSYNRKMYTNQPSTTKNTKESILSFDNSILEQYSKTIISNNLIALNEFKSKRIDKAIQILESSIDILKKFPKKNKEGFYIIN